jgi:hypothetical protein
MLIHMMISKVVMQTFLYKISEQLDLSVFRVTVRREA